MGVHTYGLMGVDWEERVNFDRLRGERLGRAKAALAATELGGLLCFDMYNIRYITSTNIGEWARDKLSRFTLLPRGDEPIMWDFGSAAPRPRLCSPPPHIFSDRALRLGDPAYFDIIHSYMGYRTCYYRSFAVGSASPALGDAYKRCREYLDMAIAMMKPGITTADIAGIWPRAQEFGFPNEEACFGLQYGHGVGLSVWEQPVISRLVSLDHPVSIEAGMVVALETFWPASDGWSAARIEEEVLVTETGHEVITRFPAGALPVAGAPHWTGPGPPPSPRDA